MKSFSRPFSAVLFSLALTSAPLLLRASPAKTDVIIQSVSGQAEFTMANGKWQPLRPDSRLGSGIVIRTRDNGTVDFFLKQSKTALRLGTNSQLVLDTLKTWPAGDQQLTETRIKLTSGALTGSQRKLDKASSFKIVTGGSVASIVGTEYVVRADGAVTVLEGSVTVNYNLPGDKGSIKVTIAAGQSFNPLTGTVVPTTPDYLNNIIADVDTVRNNAQVFQTGGATVVVRPEQPLSPFAPGGNNGVGNGSDAQPPGNPPANDGPGTGPGNPGSRGGRPR